MSINAMTNAAVARRPDFEPASGPPRGLDDIAQAAAASPVQVASPTTAQSTPPANATSTALQTLTTYIPTEVLTLYVAAVAGLGNLQDGSWIAFVGFLSATPLVVWITFASKLKSAGKPVPAAPTRWPVWEMLAATLAFVAWTFALPNTPFARFPEWYSPGLAGFLVLLVSYGLGLVAPLLQRPLAM